MKLKLIKTLILPGLFITGISQSLQAQIVKTEPNFFEIKKKADRYFKDEIRELNYKNRRSKMSTFEAENDEGMDGYFIYKRWENFWGKRVFSDGSFPAPDAAYLNFQAWKKKYNPTGVLNSGNWVAKGPDKPISGTNLKSGVGRINGMCVNPLNVNTIYACAPTGGIWKSTTGGKNFTTTTDELASIGFATMVVDYTDSNIVYAASGQNDLSPIATIVCYSLGVLKSTDGGLTYNPTGLTWAKSKMRQALKIVMDPIDHNVLLVTTDVGIFRTTDAGVNWTLTIAGSCRDIEFQPGNSNVVYATSSGSMLRSTDNGVTWATITNGLPSASTIDRLALAVTPANSNYVYAMAANKFSNSTNVFNGMYRSTDAGLTFTLQATQPNLCGRAVTGNDPAVGEPWYVLAICADPTDAEHIITGAVNVWESFDGGVTYSLNAHWSDNSGNYNYVHADIHFLDFVGNTLFCGSDGGLWKSNNFGNTWLDISDGMEITQFYRLGTSEINDTLIFAGAQDNGSFRLKGPWQKVYGGDGFEQAVSPVNANIVFSESQYNNIGRSLNGGASYSSITAGLSGNGDWNAPFLVNNTGVLYVGRQDVFKSTNNGSTYTKLTNGGMGILTDMAICKSAQSVMYATNGSAVYRINLDNGAVTTLGSVSGYKSYVAVDDNDSNKVYVTISEFTTGNKVFKSTDGGLNWTNISGNLPNIPAISIALQNDSLEGVYVGTDQGIFYRNKNFTNWQLFNDGLPNVVIDELEITYSAGKIRAATWGRGLWESDLYQTTAPVAAFTQNRTAVCPNQTVTFTDISSDGPTSSVWTFPGGVPATATGNPVTVNYPTIGVYDVTLVSGNASGSGSVTTTQLINVGLNQQLLPMQEGFESSTIPLGWSIENSSGDPSAWQLANVGSYSASAHSYVCLNFETVILGTVFNLLTQNYDLTTISNPELKFDVAYAKRTPSINDSLKVDVSLDCGDTWTSIYSKGGNSLKTTNTYYPGTSFIPAATQWRTEVLSLAAFAAQPQIMLRFRDISAKGNNIYIDNINIDIPAGINDSKFNAANVSMVPNPVTDISILTVNQLQNNSSDFQLQLFNVLGEKVKTILPSTTAKLTFEIKKTDLSSGIYIYKIVENNKAKFNGKFIVD